MIGKERLDNDEFHALWMKAGELTLSGFSALVSSPEYSTLSDDQIVKRFKKIKEAARKTARAELFGGGAAKLPPLPKGATLPPLLQARG